MAKKIKVLMLLDNEFPYDVRVEKMLMSMKEHSISVDLLNCTKTGKKSYENYKGIDIYRWQLSKLMYKFSVPSIILPFYFNKWNKEVDKRFSETKYDIIYINDLPLSSVGYRAKQKYGCKLVNDQHEYYSNWINHTAHYNKGVGKIIKALSSWSAYEKNYLSKSDLLVTVSSKLRELYIKNINLSENKIISIPNTPNKKILSYPKELPSLDKFKENYIIFYVGGIDILRGTDVAINAMPDIIKKIPNAKLVIAGPINKNYDFHGVINNAKMNNYVDYLGSLSQVELASYIERANICFFVPPPLSEEINNTIVTKIYQYAAQKKPIIISEVKMMRDFVVNNGLGLSISNNSSLQFAENVFKIYTGEFKVNESATLNDIFWEDTVSPIIEWYLQQQEQ